MRNASILPQLVEMMEAGKRSYEIEQSINRMILRKDRLEKTDNKLPFYKKRKRPNMRTDKDF